MAQRILIKTAFLPDEPCKEVAIQAMSIRKNLDRVTSVIDEVFGPDAMRLTPFGAGAKSVVRLCLNHLA